EWIPVREAAGIRFECPWFDSFVDRCRTNCRGRNRPEKRPQKRTHIQTSLHRWFSSRRDCSLSRVRIDQVRRRIDTRADEKENSGMSQQPRSAEDFSRLRESAARAWVCLSQDKSWKRIAAQSPSRPATAERFSSSASLLRAVGAGTNFHEESIPPLHFYWFYWKS